MQRQFGHLVDGVLHLLVRDPDELPLDHDVGDDEHAPRLDLPERPEREEDRRLHLDGQDPALRPAARQPGIGLVEDVARDDGAHPDRLAQLLRLVHRLVHQPEVGRRRVGLAADVVGRRRVGRRRGERDDQVSHREVGLEPPARPDPHDLPDAELDELLDHDRRRRATHSARLHGHRLALERARVPQHPALGVPLHDVLHEGVGDVLRPQRVAGEEAGLGVVALVRSYVDRHGGEAYGFPA